MTLYVIVLLTEGVQTAMVVTIGAIAVACIPAYFGYKQFRLTQQAKEHVNATAVTVDAQAATVGQQAATVDKQSAVVNAQSGTVQLAMSGLEGVLPIINGMQAKLSIYAKREQVREIHDAVAAAEREAHREWDLRLLAVARQIDPTLPDPPPIRQLPLLPPLE